jgi:hypothetical protein
MGLPGAGKTTLARVLAPCLNAVLFNADEVRANINKDLGFSEADRTEQARRMGWLTDQVVKAGGVGIADFICPTPDTRSAFLEGGGAFVVWLNRSRVVGLRIPTGCSSRPNGPTSSLSHMERRNIGPTRLFGG